MNYSFASQNLNPIIRSVFDKFLLVLCFITDDVTRLLVLISVGPLNSPLSFIRNDDFYVNLNC